VRPNLTSSGAQRRRDVDDAFAAYVCWREGCIAVDRAYSAWTSAGLADAAVAFDAYTDALDREERAANIYVRLMRQLGQLVGAGLAREPARAAHRLRTLRWREPGRAPGRDAAGAL